MTTSLVLAFSAGMVATVNPCGFAMLPAYLSYFMGIADGETSKVSILRSALVVGSVVSAGFLFVFGLAGAAISGLITGTGRTEVIEWIPWLALGVGVAVGLLGVAMVAGYQLAVGLPRQKRWGRGAGYRKVFGFGTSYAVASLSCTLPVFLTVVATQFTSRSFIGGVTIFIAYALGMATVLLGVTAVLAFGKQRLVERLRTSGRFINRISGVVLVLAGGWIVWFWTTAIRSGASALGASSSLAFVENLSQSALNFVSDNTLLVTLAFVGVITAAVIGVLRGSEGNGEGSRGAPDDDPELETASHGEPGGG
jgi:cytochrome c-type biogenesis protein